MNKRSESGFTLIEVTVVVAIAAILLTIGVPGFHAMIQRQRLTTAVNAYFGAINLTRSEAIHRGARVDLVPADGVDWAKGWVVFIDQNHNQQAEAGEQVIFSHGPVAGNISIKSVLSDSSKPYLAYNGTGRTRTNASSQAPQFGTVSFFLDAKIRRIKLNFSGRPRTCDPEQNKTCTGTSEME